MFSSRGNVFWTPRVIVWSWKKPGEGGDVFWMYIHLDLCDSGDLFRLSHSGVGQNKKHSNKSE